VFQESKSAKTEYCRPEFTRMISMIKSGEIDTIVCWKLDRLARNMTEGGAIIDMLSSGLIKAIITNDKVFYPWDNVIVMSVEFSQGKQFVKDLSVNVKRGQKKKASMGVPHGVASLGFLNDKTEEKGNRKWLVDDKRLWKIKKLFELFLTGTYSAGKLYKHAVKDLQLDTVKRKRIGGQMIVLSRIYEILKDPVYAGFFYYDGKRYDLDALLPRIITESDRDKVLQILSKKHIPKVQEHKTLYSGFMTSNEGDFIGQDMKFQLICDCKHKFAYRGKTHCPNCNREIDALENPKYLIKSYYYNVRKKKAGLDYKSIEEAQVTDKLSKFVSNNLNFSNDLLDWSKKYIHELKDKEIGDSLLMSKNKENRIQEFELKKRKMRQMLRDEKITDAEYTEDLENLNKEYSDTQKETKAIDWYAEMLDVVDLVENTKKVLDTGTFESKRAILSRLGSNLVWNDEILDIHCKKSIETLIKGINGVRQVFPKFEPSKYVQFYCSNEKNKPSDLFFSMMLAWQAEFRTFDWGRAIGDLETMKREIGHLISLV